MQAWVEIGCPYCGERIDIALDASAGGQQYVEDCQVCCRPIVLLMEVDGDGEPRVAVRREDEA